MSFSESPIGRLPQEWTFYKLNECTTKITDGTHSTVKDNPEGDYYLLSCKNIKDGNVVLGNKERLIDLDTLNKLRKRTGLQTNDILLTTVGTIGESAIIKEKVINYELQRSVAIIRPDIEKFAPQFMYYITKDRKFLGQCNGMIKGSVQKCLYLGEISNIVVPCPPIIEQKAIVKILSDLDEKIEINNKINKKLEEMAQAIFKQWFVDFEFPNEEGKPYKSSGGEMVESEFGMIPRGWGYTNLENVVLSANTGADAIRRAPIVDYDTGIKCVRVGDISNKRNISRWGYCKINKQDYKKFSLKKNDILVTRTATIGLNTLIFEDLEAVYNNGLIRLKIKENFNPIFIYQVMNYKDFTDYISKITGETSTRPNMKINYLVKYKFILPGKNVRDRFEKIMTIILDRINNNNYENEKLAISRDTLLPKLMSGEIRVPLDN
ncbi:restriction endonuclease subunit S [Clostridium sp.]|uniref:restriction endonuclease subunit S n=1 Tax=Clostridium sp. TaxID=1506 RepID=UPI0026DD405F|nr:restriction endonuclease subunit S [Clostridium sp.]MDO5040132.1 restriction endonuclease subunit S [Clostridium sp.]